MSSDLVALIGFVALFALMLLRVPVGMAMGLVGVSGFAYLVNGDAALKIIGHTSMRTVTDYTFGIIPMFLLMGAFVSNSGMSRELFRAANSFVGHFRGGLGIATIAACAGFAAISGSSVATAATFATVAYPEMRRYNYPQSFATGVIAAGGTLGAMLPPSTVLAVYGIITEQDIGKLFIAGIIPGLLAATMDMLTVVAIGRLRPDFLPVAPRHSWKERLIGLRDVWAMLLLFIFVIGGLYGGLFTPTEAGGVGAIGALLIGVARGKLTGVEIRRSLLQAVRTAAAVLTVLIGALLFGYFLTVTQTPQKVTAFLTALGLGRYGVLASDHADVHRARLPDGLAGDDHPDDSDHLPGDPAAWLRSDLVRRHYRHDGRAWAHSSAGRHERVRDQERGAGGDVLDHLPRRAAVHRHRSDPAGDPDRIPDFGALAAVAYVLGLLDCFGHTPLIPAKAGISRESRMASRTTWENSRVPRRRGDERIASQQNRRTPCFASSSPPP